ncbi:tripartite tricarboxylate transporter substrate binding protein [Cupriavidus sp. L7L]|uniref:Bug family tripartite tricarboxylate transporter substrate binding protein n=1 Tax=Cupriavidus sp. L7L TaxID=2546443 RepID=UPI00105662BB|nr:tripartite tricarboxylate transporter substrate binding protein [Cupriavidus sp. L7L]TDF64516.1 tripartite tricarboxylate transporter substrate binding protein [Cupriavidus sp. L7L]
MTPTVRRCATLVAGLTALWIHPAPASPAYPDKPVRLIVPYAAGGPTDAVARLLGQGLQKRLKQPVVVENRPGAGSIIGVEYVAKASSDGYTLLFATGAPFVISPFVNQKLPYKTSDFAPVATVASYSMLLSTAKNQPFNSLRDLLAFARSHPGKVSFGSAGNGTSNHLAGELLAHEAGVKLLHAPYRGNAAAMTDVIAGNVTVMFDMPATTLPNVQSGRIKILGSTSPVRNPLTADIPTMHEGGVTGYDVTSWFGLFASAGTPAPIVDRLNRAVNDTMNDPEVRTRLKHDGYEFKAETPAQLSERIERESRVWGNLIKSVSLRLE